MAALAMFSSLLSKAFAFAIRLGQTFTPPIAGANAIASLEQIEINGCRQWLLVRGHDANKPLLLLLHGGPGTAEMCFAHHSMREIEKHFVCVNWDQRGAGKSFRTRTPAAAMTIGQFVDDVIALIEALLQRFGQKKLFLVGHSWGSVLSMKVAATRPDLLHALVGMGQVVDMKRGEKISYDYALDSARKSKNAKAVRALEKIGPPPYKGDDLFIQRRWLSEFSGDTWAMDIKGVMLIGLGSSEYSLADVIRLGMGAKRSVRLMWPELMGVNFSRDVPELSVPVFFFVGRHDYTTPFELAAVHFESLKAPQKRLLWFENSAHMPNLEEPEKFQSELVEIAREVLDG
jgi:pimeloyl-ACP methyl ester carboxylesterase